MDASTDDLHSQLKESIAASFALVEQQDQIASNERSANVKRETGLRDTFDALARRSKEAESRGTDCVGREEALTWREQELSGISASRETVAREREAVEIYLIALTHSTSLVEKRTLKCDVDVVALRAANEVAQRQLEAQKAAEAAALNSRPVIDICESPKPIRLSSSSEDPTPGSPIDDEVLGDASLRPASGTDECTADANADRAKAGGAAPGGTYHRESNGHAKDAPPEAWDRSAANARQGRSAGRGGRGAPQANSFPLSPRGRSKNYKGNPGTRLKSPPHNSHHRQRPVAASKRPGGGAPRAARAQGQSGSANASALADELQAQPPANMLFGIQRMVQKPMRRDNYKQNPRDARDRRNLEAAVKECQELFNDSCDMEGDPKSDD